MLMLFIIIIIILYMYSKWCCNPLFIEKPACSPHKTISEGEKCFQELEKLLWAHPWSDRAPVNLS